MVKYLKNYVLNEQTSLLRIYQVIYSTDRYNLFGTRLPDLSTSVVFSWEEEAWG